MFYSQFILAKKGPLGTIWIAAHLERKLRKNQVADTDIGVSVDSILFPDVPIALRLSSHLLLGVVRIYSRKVNYLFDDCSEALLKVKQAFRSTAVDLPPEESTAPYHSITLPETFDLDDFELPDNEIFQGNYVDHHVSTREQITLQDTMDGVVYTSSQFGLDERFGDGDASQIGLDLDEVLLTDKAATMEHDDLSASPQFSYQEDEMKDEIDDLPVAADAGECAQGPSTPGLEEPDLFGTQVDQVNNEIDDHNSADLVSVKSMQEVSPSQQRDGDAIDCSLQNNVQPVGVDLHHEGDDSLPIELDRKREQKEHLACMVVTTDQDSLIPNDHCSTSSPLTISSNIECPTALIPECAGGMISASGIPEMMEDFNGLVLMNNKQPHSDQTITNCVVTGGVNVNETAVSLSCSHVTSDQENISCKHLLNMDGSRGPESDAPMKDDHTSPKHEVLNAIEMSHNEGLSCPIDEAQVSNVISPRGSVGEPQVVDEEVQVSQELIETESSNHISHEVAHPTESHLRPCTSQLSHPSLSSVEAYGADPAIGHHETIEPFVCEGNPELGTSDVQIESHIFCDKVEIISKSAASDMPEPEKMLSLGYQHDGETNNNLPMESTPNNQVVSDDHTDPAGIKCISSKKRSFTESTLTMQSVDFVESYGGTQSKRTRESIPDDDDLLSSILDGRRSSVLKLKPSPVAPEIVSTKRSRSAPHTSALKRKVLMDDMMVLHGDTIRQQLTDTEDIRRIRKKAPCTRHEIFMIQRQSAEDEIFHEPIFTCLSADLTILRNGSFDLTGIKVCDNGLDTSFLEKTNDKESHSRTNTETHGVETNIETKALQLQGDAEAQPTGIPVLSESHQSEANLESHDLDVHGHANIVSHVGELDNSQNVEMNNAGRNIDVSVAKKNSVGAGLESSSLTVSENNHSLPNDCVASLPLMGKMNILVGSMHTDIPSMPTDQNLNTSSILEDEFVEEKCNRSGVDAIEITEHSVEIRTKVQTDGLETNNLCASMVTGFKETDEYNDNRASFNGDLPLEENGSSMPGGLNENQIVASDLGSMGCDDKESRSGPIFSENTKVDCLDTVAPVLDEKETSLNEGNPVCEEAGQHSVALVLDEKEAILNEGNPVCEEAGLESTLLFPEIPAIESPFVDRNDENLIHANAYDTGFLNVGDDEIIEDDDFMPSAEESSLENSGWSSRTRAVAKYLQILFEKEDLHGRQNLCLDNILAGKTRKEASRMFFETLVLKTKDYVHVEQTNPFSSINIKPRMKLMKSDF
ncbi:PREDICTED: sister chromatid cohesion 1 protein 4-like isoform X2 [Lupinus angustifolius]|uniref:sister chromatid cohesion 1 protein 4-like isoform X2 n=1 Tax=Lupinus angustifolius TaxID=3871 RepID=UPI00092E266C|nr:PREDICTED: sister chromatid cohesion 1 protein 4-like isoform X2 [Lupinus angustifolius]